MPRTLRTTEPGEGVVLTRQAGRERRSRPYRACQAGSMTQGYSCVTRMEGVRCVHLARGQDPVCRHASPWAWGQGGASICWNAPHPLGRLEGVRTSAGDGEGGGG